NVCGTGVTLAANPAVIGTGAWSIVSGGAGSFSAANSPTSGFTGTAGVTYVLQWTISNRVCASSSSTVTIKLDAAPTVSNAGTNQTVCGPFTTLNANAPAVGTGLWSIVSGAGGSFADASSRTSGFTGTPGVTYVLQWTISNGVCAPSSSTVSIQLDAAPTVSNAGGNQTVCGTGVTLAGNVPTTGTGLWTIVSGAGGVINTPASATSTFTGTAGVTY